MGLLKFVGSKLLAMFLFVLSFGFFFTAVFGGGYIAGFLGLVSIIAGVYFLDHHWRH